MPDTWQPIEAAPHDRYIWLVNREHPQPNGPEFGTWIEAEGFWSCADPRVPFTHWAEIVDGAEIHCAIASPDALHVTVLRP